MACAVERGASPHRPKSAMAHARPGERGARVTFPESADASHHRAKENRAGKSVAMPLGAICLARAEAPLNPLAPPPGYVPCSVERDVMHAPHEIACCHDCGLFQRLPTDPGEGAIVCARCEGTLSRSPAGGVVLPVLAAYAGLALLGLALLFPFAEVSLSGGRFASTTLAAAPESLAHDGYWGLSAAVWTTLIVLPALRLGTVAAFGAALAIGRVPGWLRLALRATTKLVTWAMLEVFLVAAAIALFRLRVWMHVELGRAAIALAGAAACSLLLNATFERHAFWRRVAPRPTGENEATALPVACTECDQIAHAPDGVPCPRCGARLHRRNALSAQRAWGFLIAATLLAVPANLMPVLTITKLGRGGPKTILGGVAELADRGLMPLAVIVFVASILVPLLKLGTLGALLVTTHLESGARLALRTKFYRATWLIGRWSMIDIFATMTLVALARFGWLGNVQPEAGATAFCGVVVFTMLASESFDPRSMWDAAGLNPAVGLQDGATGVSS